MTRQKVDNCNITRYGLFVQRDRLHRIDDHPAKLPARSGDGE